MSRHFSFSPSLSRAIAIALLLILGWLQFSTLSVTSPTMDEPSHIVSGYAFLTRGDTRIKLNGPILPNLIGAVPLLLEPNLELTPPDDPAWDANAHDSISDPFVWNNTASPFRIIYLARFPFMAIGWLLGALIYRWARERNGSTAGLFALALYVFCPNLLAHSRFAMTDFEPTACAFFALYAFDRSLRQPASRRWLILAGIGLGLALASKFSLLMIAAAIVLLTILNVLTTKTQRLAAHRCIAADMGSHQENLKRTLCLSVACPASVGRVVVKNLVVLFFIAALTIWGVYFFQIGPINPGGIPVPAPGFWREWNSAQYYLNQPWPNYLFGQTSTTGWWYYFPIAFVLKTPLPILILLVAALTRTIIKRAWRNDLIFLVPSFLIFFSLFFSTNNLGFRYLLPILPLIFVYVSGLIPRSISHSLNRAVTLSPLRFVTVSLLAWQIIGTLHIYPYYLTFFNEIAGGPDHGRYVLSDSNIDWGQDLVGLKNYVDAQHIDRIKLSYFGIAHPAAYGLSTEALLPVRTAMNDQGAWWLKRYTPIDPAPGVYAISVANLMGGIWIDPGEYAFFRDRTPDTIIGNSIYIYTILPHGSPIDLSLSGLQIDQIDPETYRRFGTNDVRPRWFDATSSIIAAPDRSRIALADDRPLAPELAALFDGVNPVTHAQTIDDQRSYALYNFDLSQRILAAAQQSEQAARDLSLPVKFGDTAELIGYRVSNTGKSLALVTYWRVGNQVVTPLQLFVHVLGPDGVIIAQDDRLDASPFGWRPGDLMAQVNHLTLATPLASEQSYTLEIGLYNPVSGQRLSITSNGVVIGDQLALKLEIVP